MTFSSKRKSVLSKTKPLRHLRFARCHLSWQERLWRAVTFSMISQPLHLVSSETNPPCQGLPCQGSWRRRRLRGWTKDAFRLSGITQVLLCTTSPSSSPRSMPPPLVGEALAGGAGQTSPSRLRRATSPDKGRLCGGEVLSQHRVLLRNEISLSMAPLFRGAVERMRD